MTDVTPQRPKTFDRRRVLQGAAWAAPVVALSVAAPAVSASPCSSLRPATLNFATAQYTRNSNTQGRAVVPLQTGDTAVVVTLSNVLNNTLATAPVAQRAIYTYPATGSDGFNQNFVGNAEGLNLWIARTGNSGDARYGQQVSISFDRPTTNVKFRIGQLTRSTQADYIFIDRVWSNIVPSSQTAGATATGTGTSA